MRGLGPTLLLATACASTTTTTEMRAPDPMATAIGADASVQGADARFSLDPELASAAGRVPVETFKVRVDPAGAVTKQSLYHRSKSDIPDLVHELATRTYPESTTTSYETEWYVDRGRVFEVEVQTKDAQRCEVASTSDGKLIYTECEIAPETLPVAVKDTLERTLPGAEILEAEHKMGDEELYTVEAKQGDEEHYLYLTPGGELRKHLLRIPAVLEVEVR